MAELPVVSVGDFLAQFEGPLEVNANRAELDNLLNEEAEGNDSSDTIEFPLGGGGYDYLNMEGTDVKAAAGEEPAAGDAKPSTSAGFQVDEPPFTQKEEGNRAQSTESPPAVILEDDAAAAEDDHEDEELQAGPGLKRSGDGFFVINAPKKVKFRL